MRWSKSFIPTLKETPKDATFPSHQLLLRAGYIRMVGAGIYELLPLGVRVLNKISNIIREELNASGCQEILMPALLPAEYYKESGRWDLYGDTLLRIKDRKGGDYHLGPTHEEIVTDLIRRHVQSYKELPLLLYQVQMKYRDEPRPRAGLLRCREFLMKDAYSFDVDEASAERSFALMHDAYSRIFDRLGLRYRVVDADPGAIGGTRSAEFQVLVNTGEDAIVACPKCSYAANIEVAQYQERHSDSKEALQELKEIDTPGQKTIQDLVSFLKIPQGASKTLKALIYKVNDDVVMVIVRGDHQLNEVKLARALGVEEVSMASEAEAFEQTKVSFGSLGPVGYGGRLLIDRDAAHTPNVYAGANHNGKHLANVNFGRDYQGEVANLRNVQAGDPCPQCQSSLEFYQGIEGGHIFILGTRYSDAMNARFNDAQGNGHAIVMGCYGIGVTRLIAAAVEQNHDANGIQWPAAIAPYDLILTEAGSDDQIRQVAEEVYRTLSSQGLEVLWDERDQRPGIKFIEADLVGVPYRLTVGKKSLEKGTLEFKDRRTGEVQSLPLADASQWILSYMRKSL